MKTAIFERPDWENWNISIPLIQGGMGVGVSLSGLTGACKEKCGKNCTNRFFQKGSNADFKILDEKISGPSGFYRDRRTESRRYLES